MNKKCENPKRVSNFWNNKYIEYESNGGKNRNLSLDEYLNKIKPYSMNIIIDLQNFDVRKIQLTIEIKLYFFQTYWRRACNALKDQ